MAFSFFKRKRWENAAECCENVAKVAKKLKIAADKELEVATNEIYEGCRKEIET